MAAAGSALRTSACCCLDSWAAALKAGTEDERDDEKQRAGVGVLMS